MTDDDLDLLLSTHGGQWRDLNANRPAVDWDSLGTSNRRRAWCAVAGVVAAAAAVIVAIVVTTDDGRAVQRRPVAAPSLPATPLPRDPLDYQHGAPGQYFGLVDGTVRQVGDQITGRTREPRPVVALGGTGQGRTVYTAMALRDCRTQLDRSAYAQSGGGVAGNGQSQPVATIAGEPTATPIAVSRRAGMLALVVTPAYGGHYTGSIQPCVGNQQIVFVRLADGAVTNVVPVDDEGVQVDALAWSPDGTELAFRLSAGPGATGSLSRVTLGELGTHVMPIHETLRDLGSYPRVLPGSAPNGVSYGPVFWWHGELAAFMTGTLRPLLGGGKLGNAIATGFTEKVDTVSRDDFGDHLLISSGARSYRWDYGQLTRLPGHLLQPTW